MKNKDIVKLKIYYRDYYILLYGTMKEIPPHTHHAIQIFIDSGGDLKVTTEGTELDGQLIMINSDVSHQVSTGRSDQLTLLIDGDSREAEYLSSTIFKGSPYRTYSKSFGFASSMLENPEELISMILKACGIPDDMEQKPTDVRIVKAREIIGSREDKRISIGELSEMVNLSESRMAHLFKEQMGIPLRKYLLWRRLIDALHLVLGGRNLTEAAYESGFSDSAHLSRTFRNHFGLNLSRIFKNSRFIQFFPLKA